MSQNFRKNNSQDNSKFALKQKFILELTKKSLFKVNEEEIFDSICQEVTAIFNLSLTGIFRYEIVSNEFILVSKFDREINNFLTLIQNKPFNIAGYTFLQEKPVFYNDIKNDSKFSQSPLISLFSIKSGISCSVKTKNGKWGVFGGMSIHENMLSVEDIEFFQEIATIIGLIIDRNNYEEETLNKKAFKVASKITAGIAHDFNNYLSIISGYINRLQMDALKQISLTDEERITALTNSLSVIAKSSDVIKLLQSVGQENTIKYSTIDINKIIIDMKEIFCQKVKSMTLSDIQIDYLLSEEPSVPIKGDQTQFSEVLLNLVTNAIEAIKENGVIKISTRNILISNPNNSLEIANLGLRPSNYLHLRISDNGIGIAEENLRTIFNPYVSGKKTFSTSGSNFGLGLSIVYNIIKQMKGELKVTSRVNEGTIFNIYLPSSLE